MERPPQLRDEAWQWLVYVLKNAVSFRPLLNDFEQGFVQDLGRIYGICGRKTSFTIKQWGVLNRIAEKLDLNPPPHIEDDEFAQPRSREDGPSPAGEDRQEIPF